MLRRVASVLAAITVVVIAAVLALGPDRLAPLLRVNVAYAGSFTPSVSLSSNTKGVSSDYTITFTPATAIASGAVLNVRFQAPPDAPFGLGSTAIASGSSAVFTSISEKNSQFGYVNVSASSLPAQALTLKLSGITNPSKDGKYGVEIETFNMGSSTDRGSTNVQVGTIAISGTVKLPNTTAAMGVWVEAQDKSDFSQRFGGPTDNSDGSYGIGGLTAGKTYRVQTFLNSWDPASNVKGFSAPDAVDVTYNGTAVTQNFTLKAATKTITGTLKRSSGAAVAGARIAAMRMDGPGFADATTDASGNYTLTLSGGKYEIRPDTFAGFGQQAPDYAYSGQGTLVAFAKDDTVESKTGVNFTVTTASATIKGTLSPAPGGFSGVGIHNQAGFGTGTGVMNGAFSAKVPPGTYEVDFFMDPSQAGDKYAFPAMDPITVSDGETKDLGTIKLVKMDKQIKATVRDKDSKNGIAGFSVGCFKPRGGGFAMGQTGSDGVATLMVTDGDWGCMAMAGGGFEGSKQQAFLRKALAFLVEQAYAAAETKYVVTGGPQFVKVSGNTATSLVFDALKADRSITVTVVDLDGASLSEHGFIEAEPVGGNTIGGLGQPIDPNQPGLATVNVPAGLYDLRMMTPPGSDYSSGDATRVDVRSANASAKITLLKNDSTISGTLKDEDGNTVKGVFAFVTGSNKKGAFIPGDVNTTAGTYSLRAPSAGGDLNLGYFVDPETGYFPQPITDATVTPKGGQTVTKDITMRKATVTLNVTVKNPDGNAVKGVFVEADNRKAERGAKVDNFFHNGNQTGSDGKVTFKVPAGDFSIKAFLPPETLKANKWMPPESTKQTFAKNDTKDLTLQFQKATVELSGTVKKSNGSVAADAFVTVYADSGESIETVTDSNGKYSVFITKGDDWHVIAELDDGSSPLLSPDTAFSTGEATSVTKDLTLTSQGSLSTAVSSTFDTDNAKQVTLTDGKLDGAQVSLPADALDSDGQGSNATVNVETTVEVPRQLGSQPLGNIALNVSASGATGSALTSLTSASTAVSIPVEKSDLEAAGFTTADIGKSVTMSYYDESNGKWSALDGSVTYVEKDTDADGTNEVLVTGSTDHFTVFAVTAATDTTPPAAPTEIKAADLATGGKVRLTWKNPSDTDFDKVTIYRSTTSGTLGSKVTSTSSSSTTSYDDSGLTNDTTYFYTVRAVDKSSNESTNTTQVSAKPTGSSDSSTLPKTGTPVSPWATGGALLLLGVATAAFVARLRRQDAPTH